MAELRRALRDQLKVCFNYRDAQAEESERTVRPLCLAYYGPVWLLSGWCELRDDFRTFRLDRMADFAVPGERFRHEPGKTLHDFLKRDQTWTRSRAAPNGKGDCAEQEGRVTAKARNPPSHGHRRAVGPTVKLRLAHRSLLDGQDPAPRCFRTPARRRLRR